jgi:transcriptional regulator with XRE-family HTH domain
MGHQRSFLLRFHGRDVSDQIIILKQNFKDALKLTKDISGLTDLQLCQELDIDPGHWSRIWNGRGHFPDEKIVDFMNLCDSIVPLRWLALKYGFELRPMKSKLEAENDELREMNERLRRDLDVIKDFLRETGRQA